MQRIAVALVLGIFAVSAAAEEVALPSELEAWLNQYVARHPTYRGRPAGAPQLEHVLLAYGDLNGDRREDAVLVFPIEVSGSGWVQYAAAFSRGKEDLKFCCIARVGEQGSTKVEAISIANDEVFLRGKRFVRGVDAMCCPSAAWERTLRVTKSKRFAEAKSR